MRTMRAGYAAAILAAGLLLAGCGASNDGGSSSSSGDSATGGEVAGTAAAPAKPGQDTGQSTEQGTERSKGDTATTQPSVDRSIIRTGFLTIEDGDLRKIRDQISDAARSYGGQIANEETGTDDDGKVDHANLVVKVPVNTYDRAMTALQKLGTVKQVRQESTDVTEQVVDIQSRIATQRAGLARMRTLMTKANTIGEIVSVETELTKREADLESLLAKQKALAAQTDLATLTVTLVRPGEAPAPAKDHSGFVGGLTAGWDAFAGMVKGLATATGAILPFAVTALLIGVPVWLLVRRQRRTPSAQPPAPTQTQA